jgi:hypothetical protein
LITATKQGIIGVKMAPPHTQEYEDATTITRLSSHTYSANLSPDWVVGTGKLDFLLTRMN